VAIVCVAAIGCGKKDNGATEEMPAAVKAVYEAAERGDAEAQFALANIYYNGEGITQDYEQAAIWTSTAAEQGHIGAQYHYGLLLENGEGVERNFKEAVEWWKRAAAQGYVDAQYKLGATFALERGVAEPDYASAAQYFLQAAEQGHPLAQLALAELHHKGKGVPQDYPTAVRWYTEAANQGNGTAAFALAVIYLDGEGGVEQNPLDGYKWASIAVLRAPSAEEEERFTAVKAGAAGRMSASMLAQGDRMVQEWTDAFAQRKPQ
jgi:TPR repeat protein